MLPQTIEQSTQGTHLTLQVSFHMKILLFYLRKLAVPLNIDCCFMSFDIGSWCWMCFYHRSIKWLGSWISTRKNSVWLTSENDARIKYDSVLLIFFFYCNWRLQLHCNNISVTFIRHLMIGSKGNSELANCFPQGQSLSVLLYLPTHK